MKRAIVVDSTANIGEDLFHHPDVYQANLIVHFEESGETFTDTWDEEVFKSFYDKMRESANLPTTSQPSPQDFLDIYQSLVDQGYESAIVITIASGVSGTYNNARLMAQDFEDQIELHVVDSGSGAYGARNMVEHVLAWYDQGLATEEILKHLEYLYEETMVYGALHDLTNIKKGGRISHLAGRFADMFQLSAVLSVHHSQIHLEKVARGKKRVRKAMGDILDKFVEGKSDPYRIAVMHTNDLEAAQEAAAELREHFKDAKDIVIDNMTIVLGTQLGEGILAYVYMPWLIKE